MARKLLISAVSLLLLGLFMVVGCSSTPSKPSTPNKVYTYVVHYSMEIPNDTIYAKESISSFSATSDYDFVTFKKTNGLKTIINKMNIIKIERIP